VKATEKDVLANIPYIKGCGLWFDHHASENKRLGDTSGIAGQNIAAPSCARIIYNYYGGAEKLGRFAEMVDYVDRVDSAALTRDEIMDPQGWILLGFIMDPRTGLGRFRNFRISNYDLMQNLSKACADKTVDEILAMEDVQERIGVYHEQAALFTEMVKKHSRIDGPVIITDLRGVDPIYAGNRFLIYTIFPEQNISLWTIDGRNKANCVITVGYSIINRTAAVDVGALLLKYGGGGHRQAGTCQVPYESAGRIIAEIVEQLK
jgi:nanoRNase/pAp phosphatase (c-di-AMP/oligoRNAs hydrolase)